MARPVSEGLFTDGEPPRLIGGRRRSDGKVVFPAPSGPEAQQYERIELSPRGTLWSFTVQRFRPKSPPYVGDDDERSFKPFAIGYVELPGEVIVESRLVADDFARIHGKADTVDSGYAVELFDQLISSKNPGHKHAMQ